jgi:photosystem II stability/assembly factor-like uncharacterized protein
LPDRFTIRAQVILIDPINPRRVYTGTTEGLFVSDNDGQAWKRLTPADVTVNAIQVDPANNQRIFIGTEYQGIMISEDSGRTWNESNTGFVHKQISWILPDLSASGQLIAGELSGRGGFYRYDDRELKWTLSHIEPGMRILSFLVLPNDLGTLAGTSQGVYWQKNKSPLWTKLKGSISKRAIYSLAIDPVHPVAYAGTDQGIYRASLPGMDFRLPPGSRISPKVWCLSASPSSSGVIYAGTSLGILRSTDRGTIWKAISAYGLPERIMIESIAIAPSGKDHLFAGTAAGLYESKNGGIHWRQAEDPGMGVSVSTVLFLDGAGLRILAADKASGGVFYSQNGGANWEKVVSPYFKSPSYCIARDPEKASQVYIGTQSEGIYRLTLP